MRVRLRAVTEPLDGPSPSAASDADTRMRTTRRDLWGWGRAATLRLPAPWIEQLSTIDAVLSDCETTDAVRQPGTGPLAFAALPSDPGCAAVVVIPAVVIGSTPEGHRWITRIESATGTLGAQPIPGPRRDGRPRSVRLASHPTAAEWCASVAAARERIAAGHLTKVVLARRLQAIFDSDVDPRGIADRLEAAHPASMRFLVDGFCGASPELLVSRTGDMVRAQPMAGTTARSGDPVTDARRAAELLASEKNRAEHQITIDAVVDALLPWCSYLDSEPEPHVAEAGSVAHLATLVEGRLSHPTPSVLELVAALHPTPAVGGWPRTEAMALQRTLEPFDRGRYGGAVGWVDAVGNGSWAVAVRTVSVHGDTAEMFAGVGVVEDSDPAAELAETDAKFATTVPNVIREV